jgi:hypothetical protein
MADLGGINKTSHEILQIKIMNGVIKLEKAKVSSQRYITVNPKNNRKSLILNFPKFQLRFWLFQLLNCNSNGAFIAEALLVNRDRMPSLGHHGAGLD